MDLSLKEKFILLALNPEKGTNLIPTFIGHGIAGAMLMELAGMDKIRIEDDRIKLVDRKSTGNEQLDYMTEVIGKSSKPMKVKSILQKLQGKSSRIKKPLIQGLVKKRFLHEKQKRFLFIKYKVYPSANRKYRDDLVEHIRRLVLRDIKLDDDIPLLTGLVGATQLHNKFFKRREERKIAKKRIKEIVQQNKIDKAIDETVKAVQAAVAVSIATTAAVSVAASGN